MSASQERLAGRTVLITGASSGLGERFARIAAAEGAKVVAGARRTDRLRALAEELAAQGRHCLAVPLDVGDEASIQAVFAAGEAAFGPITGIVANAGVNKEGAAIDLPIAEFDALFGVNVRGAFLTAREAARRLRDHGRSADGRIVLISSITARMTTPGLAAYSASKAAVTHLGKMLAREWARTGPNVSALSPGYIRTELAGDWFDTEGGKKQMAKWPRRPLLDEDALDEALVWLLSDASRNVTGSDIVIDDGQSL
jgi:NAD(P)-dependent dehydrogenase (short-subunit alcohol dehydrogenase family)